MMCIICLQKCYFHPTVPHYYRYILRSPELSVFLYQWEFVALIVFASLEASLLVQARLRAIPQHDKVAARSPADHWCLDWRLAALSVLLHGILPGSLLVG